MRSGNKIIRLTRAEPSNSGRRKRTEAKPEVHYTDLKIALGVVMAISMFLITAFTLNPYDMQEAQAEALPYSDLPPIRDVSMDPVPLWEAEPGTFIDPPTREAQDWIRVGSAQSFIIIT